MTKLVNPEYMFVIVVVVLTWCWQIEGFANTNKHNNNNGGGGKNPFEKSQTENLNSIGDQCFCKVKFNLTKIILFVFFSLKKNLIL